MKNLSCPSSFGRRKGQCGVKIPTSGSIKSSSDASRSPTIPIVQVMKKLSNNFFGGEGYSMSYLPPIVCYSKAVEGRSKRRHDDHENGDERNGFKENLNHHAQKKQAAVFQI